MIESYSEFHSLFQKHFNRFEQQHNAGEYRFCFDNTISTFSTKTVFFELLLEDPDNPSDGIYFSLQIKLRYFNFFFSFDRFSDFWTWRTHSWGVLWYESSRYCWLYSLRPWQNPESAPIAGYSPIVWGERSKFSRNELWKSFSV